MRTIVIAPLLAMAACGPAFTVAPADTGDGLTLTDDGGIAEMRPTLDGGESSAVDASREATSEVDSGESAADSARPEVDAGEARDAAAVVDAEQAPDHVAPPPADAGGPPPDAAGPPRCDAPYYAGAICAAWFNSTGTCSQSTDALCCRTDGVCGCKVTSTAACL